MWGGDKVSEARSSWKEHRGCVDYTDLKMLEVTDRKPK